MARSIPVIYNQLLIAKNAQSNLSGLTSTSQVSTWNLWLWITAVGQNLFEQVCDLFTANIEMQIANAPVFTPQWIVQMCKLFQYSSSSAQNLQLNTSVAYPYITLNYPVVNSSLCPITQAAVTTTNNSTIVIKVASNSTPLTSGQLSALTSYLNSILPAGTQWTILSASPDQVFIQAQVYYNASYSGVIQANMDAAIYAFFAAIPFNGTFEISALLTAMLAVTGVTDVVFNNVQARESSQEFGTGTNLVTGNQLLNREWNTYAGYAIPETTTGQTIDQQITYMAS